MWEAKSLVFSGHLAQLTLPPGVKAPTPHPRNPAHEHEVVLTLAPPDTCGVHRDSFANDAAAFSRRGRRIFSSWRLDLSVPGKTSLSPSPTRPSARTFHARGMLRRIPSPRAVPGS